jgi:fatty-acyl-CoA synthase
MSGVPLQFDQIAALPEFDEADLSSLQLCTIAGARVSVPTLRAWLEKGLPLRQAYGMTELSGLSSINPASEAVNRPGSIGRGTVFTRHRIVRPNGKDCDPAEPGEIIVKGPGIAPGYWRNEQASAALVRDGWLHTGDVGVRDADGFIEVIDRMKDLIISGGYNIAPSEIEAAINEMPGVTEVCVIPASDAKFGETPAAIVHGAESLIAEDVVTWCGNRLAPYKVPRYVVIERDPLPRMASGKIARLNLEQQYAEIAATQPRLR